MVHFSLRFLYKSNNSSCKEVLSYIGLSCYNNFSFTLGCIYIDVPLHGLVIADTSFNDVISFCCGNLHVSISLTMPRTIYSFCYHTLKVFYVRAVIAILITNERLKIAWNELHVMTSYDYAQYNEFQVLLIPRFYKAAWNNDTSGINIE